TPPHGFSTTSPTLWSGPRSATLVTDVLPVVTGHIGGHFCLLGRISSLCGCHPRGYYSSVNFLGYRCGCRKYYHLGYLPAKAQTLGDRNVRTHQSQRRRSTGHRQQKRIC